EDPVLGRAVVEHPHRVRMRELRRRAHLAPEALDRDGIGLAATLAGIAAQHLHRDLAAETLVPRGPHLTHAAAPETTAQPIASDAPIATERTAQRVHEVRAADDDHARGREEDLEHHEAIDR